MSSSFKYDVVDCKWYWKQQKLTWANRIPSNSTSFFTCFISWSGEVSMIDWSPKMRPIAKFVDKGTSTYNVKCSSLLHDTALCVCSIALSLASLCQWLTLRRELRNEQSYKEFNIVKWTYAMIFVSLMGVVPFLDERSSFLVGMQLHKRQMTCNLKSKVTYVIAFNSCKKYLQNNKAMSKWKATNFTISVFLHTFQIKCKNFWKLCMKNKGEKKAESEIWRQLPRRQPFLGW